MSDSKALSKPKENPERETGSENALQNRWQLSGRPAGTSLASRTGQAGVGIASFSVDGRILALNRRAAQNLGGVPGDFAGRSLQSLFGEEGKLQFETRKDQFERLGYTTFEDLVQDPAGDRWYLSIWEEERDEANQLSCFTVYSYDITHRKNAEEQLRASEEKYRRLHESMTDAFVKTDLQGRILEFNRAFQEMLGFGPEELLRYSYGDLTPSRWHEMENQIVLEQILPRGFSEVYEKEYQRKDGSVFPVELRTFLVKNKANEPEGMWAIVRDITERRRTENALRESEDALRRLLQNLNAGVVVHAPDTRILLANEQASVLLGLTVGQMTGKDAIDPAWCFVREDESRMPVEEYPVTRVLETRAPIRDLELGINRPALQDRVWVLINAFPEFDSTGGLRQIVVTFVDITKRKNTENALKKSEDDFRYIFEHSAVGKSITLPSGEIHVNETFAKMLGYEPRELERKSWREVTHPEDIEKTASRMAALLSGERDSAQFVKRFLRKDGEVVWTELRSSVRRDPSGTPLYFMTSMVDITDRMRAEEALRASEEQLRLATEAANLGIYARDLGNGLFHADEKARRLFGFGKEDIRLEDIRRRIHPDDYAPEREAFSRALSPLAKLDRTVVEFRIILPSGEVRWVSVSALVHFEGDGPARRAVSIVGTTQDITERKKAEESLLRVQKLEALGTLAGGVAHDFNNILLAIRGNASIAAADLPENHPIRPCFEEISRASKRGADLVRQVLAFARPQSAGRTVLPLQQVVEEAKAFLRATIPALIDIQWRAEGSCPLVSIDPGQIHQAIVNLVMNSADAIGSRAGLVQLVFDEITIDEKSSQKLAELSPGRYARLRVKDDGPGMDAETLRQVFDPFFTTKTPDKGTGLGLSIVHGIMRSHGGSISISSEPGHGTDVSLYFPAAAIPVSQEPPRAPRAGRLHSERLLFDDDDDALVFLAKRTLGRLGFVITAFTDPTLALAEFHLRPHDFDGVITDVSMPKLSGFDLARELLAVRPDIPVIITSGYIESEEREMALKLGARAVILKPDTVDEMAATLDRIFESASGGSPGPS